MPNEPELSQRIAKSTQKPTVLLPRSCCFWDLLVLLNSIDNPRIATLRGTDVLRLFAIGLGFGIGAGFLVGGSMLSRLIQDKSL